MTQIQWLVGGLMVAILVFATLAFRVLHAPPQLTYRTDATDWSQLETRLNFLGTGGWELVAIQPDRSDPKIVWSTFLRQGSARAYRATDVPDEKEGGRGPVPAYHEGPL